MIKMIRIVRGFLFSAGLLFAVAAINHDALAQSSTPVVDLFGGYSFASLEGQNAVGRQETHGFGVSGTVNLSRSFGLTGDFSYGWGKLDLPISIPVDVKFTTQTFLFGPTLSARGDRATVFGHALFGGMRGDAQLNVIPVSLSDTKFAMGFGGGVDFNLTDRFAIRAIQADYIPIRDEGFWNHSYRLQTGVVFRF